MNRRGNRDQACGGRAHARQVFPVDYGSGKRSTPIGETGENDKWQGDVLPAMFSLWQTGACGKTRVVAQNPPP